MKKIIHDLKAPLTVISLWAEILKNYGTDPLILNNGIKEIQQSIVKQVEILDNLKDISLPDR